MQIFNLFHRIIAGIAVLTTFGILVHDTKFDEAIALAVPVATITAGLGSHALDFGGNSHTHVERASMAQAFSGIPRLQARDDHRRYLPKYAGRQSDFFGGSRILWPNI